MIKIRSAIGAVCALSLTGLLGACASDGMPATAVMDPAAAMTARHEFMAGLGGNLRALRGPDAAAAMVAANDIHEGFMAFKNEFPEGSQGGRAKPEIWTNRADFNAKVDGAIDASHEILEAAGEGDAAAITTAAGAMTQTCGGCHALYRS